MREATCEALAAVTVRHSVTVALACALLAVICRAGRRSRAGSAATANRKCSRINIVYVIAQKGEMRHDFLGLAGLRA